MSHVCISPKKGSYNDSIWDISQSTSVNKQQVKCYKEEIGRVSIEEDGKV